MFARDVKHSADGIYTA